MGLGTLGSTEAQAGPKTNDLDQGGFIYLSPGIVGIDVTDDDIDDLDADVNYQASFGVGYLWSPKGNFKIAASFAAENMLDSLGRYRIWLRLLPELRIGGGNDRVFGYGLIGTGGAILFREGRDRGRDEDDDDDDVFGGFNLQMGGGAQVVVWKGLAVGGELDTDIAFMFEPDWTHVTVGLKAVAAWYF